MGKIVIAIWILVKKYIHLRMHYCLQAQLRFRCKCTPGKHCLLHQKVMLRNWGMFTSVLEASWYFLSTKVSTMFFLLQLFRKHYLFQKSENVIPCKYDWTSRPIPFFHQILQTGLSATFTMRMKLALLCTVHQNVWFWGL